MRHIIVANWKSWPNTAKEATTVFDKLKVAVTRMRSVDLIIATPPLYLPILSMGYKGNKLALSSQDISVYTDVPHTSEIRAEQVYANGCSYTLVGHSEVHDTPHDVRIKVFNAFKYKLTPIVFLGEESRDPNGKYLGELKKKVLNAVKELNQTQLNELIICYEPIWAIGQQEAMDTYDIHQTVLYIRKVLIENFGAGVARKARILYGGSVNLDNISGILNISDIDGVAVGRLSINSDNFIDFLKVVNKIK